MKKLLFLFLMSCISIQGFSQEKLTKLSVNPLQLFAFNISNIEFERGFSNGKIGISFFYGVTGRTTRALNNYNFYISEQNISIKRYSKSISHSSFWYGGQVSVSSVNILYNYDFNSNYNKKEYEKYKNNRATDVGVLGFIGKVGYQFILSSFYLDIYGGVGFAATNNLFGKAQYKGEIKESRLLLLLGLKTGISF